KLALAQELEVEVLELADGSGVAVDLGAFVKLGKTLGEPHRHHLPAAEREQMSIFVIDDAVGMIGIGGVQAEEDQIVLLGTQEVAGKFELALAEIGRGLQGLELPLVRDGEHLERRGGIAQAGESLVKDLAHALELAGDMAGVAEAAVAGNDEMGRGDAHPLGRGRGGDGHPGDDKNGTRAHSYFLVSKMATMMPGAPG